MISIRNDTKDFIVFITTLTWHITLQEMFTVTDKINIDIREEVFMAASKLH